MGWHASDTALITFDDVFVPERAGWATRTAGFYLIMANFQWERLLMALGAIGAMQVSLERALPFAKQRENGDRQAVRHELAEVAMRIETSRAVTYAALRRYLAGEDAVREVTIAKLATQRAAFEVIDAALQIRGLDGYMNDEGLSVPPATRGWDPSAEALTRS